MSGLIRACRGGQARSRVCCFSSADPFRHAKAPEWAAAVEHGDHAHLAVVGLCSSGRAGRRLGGVGGHRRRPGSSCPDSGCLCDAADTWGSHCAYWGAAVGRTGEGLGLARTSSTCSALAGSVGPCALGAAVRHGGGGVRAPPLRPGGAHVFAPRSALRYSATVVRFVGFVCAVGAFRAHAIVVVALALAIGAGRAVPPCGRRRQRGRRQRQGRRRSQMQPPHILGSAQVGAGHA